MYMYRNIVCCVSQCIASSNNSSIICIIIHVSYVCLSVNFHFQTQYSAPMKFFLLPERPVLFSWRPNAANSVSLYTSVATNERESQSRVLILILLSRRGTCGR